MQPKGNLPRFCDPYEFDQDPGKQNHFPTVYGSDVAWLLAVIVPRSLAGALPQGDLFDEISVPVLTPRQAKGLEFDHVVVVEPAAVADDGDRGLRELYVALTRPTKTLVVVHARPLPEPLGR